MAALRSGFAASAISWRGSPKVRYWPKADIQACARSGPTIRRQLIVIAAGGTALTGTKLNDTVIAFALPRP